MFRAKKSSCEKVAVQKFHRKNVTLCKSFVVQQCNSKKLSSWKNVAVQKFPSCKSVSSCKNDAVQKRPSVQKSRRAKVSPRAKVTPRAKVILRAKVTLVQKWHPPIKITTYINATELRKFEMRLRCSCATLTIWNNFIHLHINFCVVFFCR